MRRFWRGYLVYLVVVASGAAVLLAARDASHRLVHDFLCQDSLDAVNAYLVVHPGAWTDTAEPLRPTLAEVRDHFEELTRDQTTTTQPTPPLYPLARVAGLLEPRPILLSSFAVALVPLCWSQRRRSTTRPQATNLLPRTD